MRHGGTSQAGWIRGLEGLERWQQRGNIRQPGGNRAPKRQAARLRWGVQAGWSGLREAVRVVLYRTVSVGG